MRITGGVHRSRTLVAPRGQETRPTSDRVREALFSMLAADGVFDPEGPAPRVLDLYAGSGALGLEALSRGGGSLVAVEGDRNAIAAIRQNVTALGLSAEVRLLAMRVERALGVLEGEISAGGPPFDLALLDPPYATVRERGFAAILERTARLLAASSILVLEHASSDEPEPPSSGEDANGENSPSRFVVDRRRRHGDTTISLFRRPPR